MAFIRSLKGQHLEMTTNESSKSLSQQRFARFARGYVTSEAHAKGAELSRLAEIAQPQTDWFMLDAAQAEGTLR